jgi:hypothetical protein
MRREPTHLTCAADPAVSPRTRGRLPRALVTAVVAVALVAGCLVSGGASAPADAASPSLMTVKRWAKIFRADEPAAYRTLMSKASTADASKIYESGYYWQGYTSMYEATGNPWYLKRMARTVSRWIRSAKPSSRLPGSYSGRRRGWVNKNSAYASVRDEYPLLESYGWRFVARMLYDMKREPSLAPQYRRIRTFTVRHVWKKWYARGTGNLYRQNAHMASHWAVLGMHLGRVAGQRTVRRQATTVARNILVRGLPNYGRRSIKSQLGRNPANRRAYFWNYNWGSRRRPGSDVNHGEAVVTAAVYAHNLGYRAYGRDEMRKFRVMLGRVIWPHGGSGAGYLDGSGRGNGWLDGYAVLGRFGTTLQRRLQGAARARSSIWFSGNMALGARKLRQARR